FPFWLAFNQGDLLDPRRIGWTPGGNLRIVFEGVVDEAAFVRIHWLELERTARDTHAFGQLAHALDDSVFAHGTIMFAINDNFGRLLVPGLQQPVEQKLDGLERFAVATDQSPAFLGVDLQGGIAALVGGLLDLNNETEITKHRVEQFLWRHHRFRFPAGATFSSVGIGWRLF